MPQLNYKYIALRWTHNHKPDVYLPYCLWETKFTDKVVFASYQ